mmetsp:Transcript_3272/g.10911  ORF Transcript_3272/g.10911 Transcript_3272/m.10911 type:complete len:324 (+) Transcript_3272:96-1067(+)
MATLPREPTRSASLPACASSGRSGHRRRQERQMVREAPGHRSSRAADEILHDVHVAPPARLDKSVKVKLPKSVVGPMRARRGDVRPAEVVLEPHVPGPAGRGGLREELRQVRPNEDRVRRLNVQQRVVRGDEEGGQRGGHRQLHTVPVAVVGAGPGAEDHVRREDQLGLDVHELRPQRHRQGLHDYEVVTEIHVNLQQVDVRMQAVAPERGGRILKAQSANRHLHVPAVSEGPVERLGVLRCPLEEEATPSSAPQEAVGRIVQVPALVALAVRAPQVHEPEGQRHAGGLQLPEDLHHRGLRRGVAVGVQAVGCLNLDRQAGAV